MTTTAPLTPGKRALHPLVVLLVLGAALASTNAWFPAVDDECAIIGQAAQPVSQTLHLYFSGAGEHEHPPLYDLILHGWLRLTGGEMHLLRLPAIVFYLLGAYALAAAAKHLAGERGRAWVLTLIALWPFGFHFGRVAAWYSFCFLLVSLLTWAYLVYLERPTLANWTRVIVCALLLVYSNYFGWALLGLLFVDLAVRDPWGLVRHWRRLVLGGAALVVLYLPILAAFVGELHRGVQPAHSVLGMLLTGIYNLYCVFVSESVAPWFWALGVPAGIAVAVSLIVTFWRGSASSKRFLLYFVVLLAVLTILGVVETKRVLLIAPWLILPIAVTLGEMRAGCSWGRALIFSLAVVAGIGWYGIFARNLYAAPHWVEPWNNVAQRAATVVRDGGVVIGNNASFFFYMTYAVPEQRQPGANQGFTGLLPGPTRRPGVYDPQQWLAESRPTRPTVLLVKGLHFGIPNAPTEETERLLAERCELRDVQKMTPDPGAAWKQRFAPEAGQLSWRVEVNTYACK